MMAREPDVREYDVQDEYVLWISLLLEHGKHDLAKIIAREQLIRTAQYVADLNADLHDEVVGAERELLKAS